MKRSTRDWVRKAEDDYRLAVLLAERTEPFHDQLCFHCQQSAEKYLKALLEELGLSVPKIHDLDYLLNLLRASCPSLVPFRRGLLFLSAFAVDTRYPGNRMSKRQATSALRWIARVREGCRNLLGIRLPRRRKN